MVRYAQERCKRIDTPTTEVTIHVGFSVFLCGLTLGSQIRELQLATSQPLGFSIQYTVTALAALGVAFYNSWTLTLVTIATFPFAAIVLSWISAKMQPSISAQEESLAKAAKLSGNAMSAIETVKVFNGQGHELRQYAVTIREAARSYLVQANANAAQIGFVRLITLAMFVQGFWYGSTLIGHNISSGQVLTTFWAALMATQAIEQLLPQMIVLEKGRAAGATLKAVIFKMERGRRITEMAGSQIPARCRGDIDIRGVGSNSECPTPFADLLRFLSRIQPVQASGRSTKPASFFLPERPFLLSGVAGPVRVRWETFSCDTIRIGVGAFLSTATQYRRWISAGYAVT